MKRIKYFIAEKLKLNNQSKLSNNEKSEYDFYDLIKELENLSTSYGKPQHITSTLGRKNYSLEEGNCYLYSSTANRNDIKYIYNIMDVSDENTGNIEHLCIIITKYPSRKANDQGLIGIHAAIIYDDTTVDTILKSITENINKFQKSSYFHIINMEQFLKDFKTFINLLLSIVPSSPHYKATIKDYLSTFNRYLVDYSKTNNRSNKNLIKFYKV